jgi:hypothetical protein
VVDFSLNKKAGGLRSIKKKRSSVQRHDTLAHPHNSWALHLETNTQTIFFRFSGVMAHMLVHDSSVHRTGWV